MFNIAVVLLMLVPIGFVLAMIRPKLFKNRYLVEPQRKTLAKLFAVLFVAAFLLGMVTEPKKEEQAKQAQAKQAAAEQTRKKAADEELQKQVAADLKVKQAAEAEQKKQAKEEAERPRKVAWAEGSPLCREAVLRKASIPSSVDFSWGGEFDEYTDGTFHMTGSFTHSNAFGQKLKKEFECAITLSKSGQGVSGVKIVRMYEAR